MRITNEVYLIGGGANVCFGLSDDPDCHIYLIDTGAGLAIVDAGLGEGDSINRITANILAEGLDLADLKWLLLTHYHMDHVGGAAKLRDRFNLEVWAPAEAAEVIRTGDEGPPSLTIAKASGLYPMDFTFDACPVDVELRDGDRLRLGDLELEVIDTPGHCHGHQSFLLHGRDRRYLFAGDAIFAGGKVVWQNIWDNSVQDTVATINKLSSVEFDALCPGHAAVIVEGGRRHVEIAQRKVESLGLPQSLV